MSSEIDQGTLRRIDWLAIFPWLMLLRTFRIAISFRVLWVSVIGVLLTMIMAMGVHHMQLRSSKSTSKTPEVRDLSNPEEALSLQNSLVPWIPGLRGTTDTPWPSSPRVDQYTQAEGTMTEVWSRFSVPMIAVFHPESSWKTRGRQGVWFLWLLLVWSIAGGMICRTAATSFTSDLTDAFGRLLDFIGRKWRSFVGLFLLPIVGILLCMIPCYFAGLLLSWTVTGWLAALLWPIALLFGFLIALLGVGFVVGWPMGFAALATEDSDAFDAVSRVFSYVYQRPMHFLLYLLLAGLIGYLGWLVVTIFLQLILYLVWQFTPWNDADPHPGFLALQTVRGGRLEVMAVKPTAMAIVHFWNSLLIILQQAYAVSYFWTASTGIYLLMRRQVDATPIDEIKHFEPAATVDPPLDPIAEDDQGAPELAETKTEADAPESKEDAAPPESPSESSDEPPPDENQT
jgi:hypothetical protein